MKTLAVMCIALTRQSPSEIRDSRSASSTWGVMFSNPMREGTWSTMYRVKDFIRCLPGSIALRRRMAVAVLGVMDVRMRMLDGFVPVQVHVARSGVHAGTVIVGV